MGTLAFIKKTALVSILAFGLVGLSVDASAQHMRTVHTMHHMRCHNGVCVHKARTHKVCHHGRCWITTRHHRW